MKQLPLITSFVLFIMLCASAAYWAMQFFKPPPRTDAAAVQTVRLAPRPDAAAGLFGGGNHAATASNFQLKGVIVASNPVESIAILVADGKPSRSVRVNAVVVPGVTLNQVHGRYVLLFGVSAKSARSQFAQSSAWPLCVVIRRWRAQTG